MNTDKLTRDFWSFTRNNMGDVRTTHIAIYLYAIEVYKLEGYNKVFDFSAARGMDGAVIFSSKTYKICFEELVNWGFLKVEKKAKSKYSTLLISIPYKENTNVLQKGALLTYQLNMFLHNASLGWSVLRLDEINNTLKEYDGRFFNYILALKDRPDRLEYVGYTSGLYLRLKKHLSNKSFDTVYVLWFNSLEEALENKKKMIKTFQPKLNRYYRNI